MIRLNFNFIKPKFSMLFRIAIVLGLVFLVFNRAFLSNFNSMKFDVNKDNPHDFFSNSSDAYFEDLRNFEDSFELSVVDRYYSYALRFPYDGRLYVLLSKWYREHGDNDLSMRALEFAKALSPQRLDVRLESISYNLEKGDINKSIHDIDILLSSYSAYRPIVFPFLFKFLVNDYDDDVLNLILGSSRVWLVDFLVYFINSSKDLELTRSVYHKARLVEGLRFERIDGAYVRKLQTEGLWLEAYFSWVNTLSLEQKKSIANVHNGGFDEQVQSTGFDWTFLKVKGVLSDVYVSDNGSHALRVQFLGQRVNFRHVTQFINLSPARYTLVGKVKMDRFEAYKGLRWSIYCVNGNRHVASTDPFKGSFNWRGFETTFTVPEEGCFFQRLQLELVGKVELDFEATGVAWFDDVRIERLVK